MSIKILPAPIFLASMPATAQTVIARNRLAGNTCTAQVAGLRNRMVHGGTYSVLTQGLGSCGRGNQNYQRKATSSVIRLKQVAQH
jgi:hypothetical protein